MPGAFGSRWMWANQVVSIVEALQKCQSEEDVGMKMTGGWYILDDGENRKESCDRSSDWPLHPTMSMLNVSICRRWPQRKPEGFWRCREGWEGSHRQLPCSVPPNLSKVTISPSDTTGFTALPTMLQWSNVPGYETQMTNNTPFSLCAPSVFNSPTVATLAYKIYEVITLHKSGWRPGNQELGRVEHMEGMKEGRTAQTGQHAKGRLEGCQEVEGRLRGGQLCDCEGQTTSCMNFGAVPWAMSKRQASSSLTTHTASPKDIYKQMLIPTFEGWKYSS
ncbi:hypothetical protein F5146DRAFT_1006872 [Armillaria mellea]|nr:hypothetical protein F5146DRAFT_1006872 [Armillaria mellea]